MPQYRVSWGAITKVVEAGCEADAWAEFCDRTSEAHKHPSRYMPEVVSLARVEPVAVAPVAVAEAALEAEDDEDFTPLEELIG